MLWFSVIATFVIIFAVGFLCNALILYILCWGLKAVGITSIGGWTVAFSWPLVILFTVITGIIRGLFPRMDSSSNK